jgi:toxin ParE1/3/4
MAGFFLSGKAKADVKDIGRYTQERWGVEQRNRYLGDLDACFQKIGANATLGNPAEAIRVGYRARTGRPGASEAAVTPQARWLFRA